MEGQIQEFGVELRGGQVSATEWQLTEHESSLEAAKRTRDFWIGRGYGARVVTRNVTPWRVVE